MLLCGLWAVGAMGKEGPKPTSAAGVTIQIEPPSKVGTQYLLDGKGTEVSETLISRDGQSVRREQIQTTVALRAKVQIQQVDAQGLVTQQRLVVQSIALQQNGHPEESVKVGDVLIATSQGKKTVFTVEGASLTKTQKALPEGVQAALELVAGTHTSDVNDDLVFGSSAKRTIGESWPIHQLAALQNLDGLELPPNGISGQTRLNAVVPCTGVSQITTQCAQVTAEMLLQGLRPKGPPPRGFGTQKSSGHMVLTGLFPVVGGGPPPALSTVWSMQVTLNGKSGGKAAGVVIETNSRRTTDVSRTALPTK